MTRIQRFRYRSFTLLLGGVCLCVFPLLPLVAAVLPLTHDVYLWQRSWDSDVKAAVGLHSSAFSELVVLAAEVSWKGKSPRLTRVALDYDALKRCSPSVGLALRIGPFNGPFSGTGEPLESLSQLASGLLQEAKENGIIVRELQLDFDCADSKLSGYAAWIQSLRRQIRPVAVTITALPSWLFQSAFKELVRATDGYVLQVHSLQRPKGINDPFDLCPPDMAIRAVDRAGKYGIPFRVALPTYGYRLIFDASGKFLALAAETLPASLPANVRMREVQSDPAAMAELVRHWASERPAALRGIIWYRLPVRGDQLNWPWPTLATVMAGQAPQERWRFDVQRSKTGLVEISVVNEGQLPLAFPAAVTVRWGQSRLIAADGSGGYVFTEDGPRGCRLQLPPATPTTRLRPGAKHLIGWMRLTKDEEVCLELAAYEPSKIETIR